MPTLPRLPVRPLWFILGFSCARLLLRAWSICPIAPRLARRHRLDIIDHAHEAIISANAEHTIILANPAAAAMFGTTVEQMQGRALSVFIPQPEHHVEPNRVGYFGQTGINARSPGRRIGDYAVTGRKANGATFALEGSLSTMRHNGENVTTIIVRDISARTKFEDALARSHAQLRALSQALQTIREEERKHIARELHDDLGQLLASLRMDLTLLRQASPARAAPLMQGMDEHLLAAITSLRRIATNLRPRALDEGGLYFALRALRDQFDQRYGVACTLRAGEAELILGDNVSTAVYRIVQEGLTNIGRHAQARHVDINLRVIGAELFITVADDGLGMVPTDMEKATSLGLVGMRERVWGVGGDIVIESSSGHGTCIEIILPLRPERSEQNRA